MSGQAGFQVTDWLPPLHERACRECGRKTEGWGGKAGVVGIDIERGDQYPLCPDCGGKCCGDCVGECEFGFVGSPLAAGPEN